MYAAKKLFNWDADQFKFLWLNSNVKYRRITLYIEEFANAGINYHYQLVDDNNNYLSFGDLAQKYDLRNENELFLKYVKLYLSIPEKWEGNISAFQCTPNNYLEMVKENCRDKWQSTSGRVVSASGSETRDSSSTPASAVIYDAYNSIIKKQKKYIYI